MEEKFKKARMITFLMMASVIFFGVVALMFSDRGGHGASSEGKMNFMRAIIFVFSATQIVLAFVIRKTVSAMSKTTSPARLLSMQITINAFCEAIALFGLALVFISKSFMDYAVFALISLSAFAFFFPRQRDWESQSANKVTGV